MKKRLKEMKKAEIESGRKLGFPIQESSVLSDGEEVSPQEILPKIEKEELSPILEDEPNVKESQADFTWKHWFSIPAFYIYGVVYMGSRVLANVQSVNDFLF